MSEHEQKLLQLGFRNGGDGTLVAPAASRITLTSTDGHFFRLEIALPRGTVSCIVPVVALKIDAPREVIIDPAAMIGE